MAYLFILQLSFSCQVHTLMHTHIQALFLSSYNLCVWNIYNSKNRFGFCIILDVNVEILIIKWTSFLSYSWALVVKFTQWRTHTFKLSFCQATISVFETLTIQRMDLASIWFQRWRKENFDWLLLKRPKSRFFEWSI